MQARINYLDGLPLCYHGRRACLSQHDRTIFSDAPGGCPPLCGRPDIACRPHRLRQGTMAREQSRVLTRRAVPARAQTPHEKGAVSLGAGDARVVSAQGYVHAEPRDPPRTWPLQIVLRFRLYSLCVYAGSRALSLCVCGPTRARPVAMESSMCSWFVLGCVTALMADSLLACLLWCACALVFLSVWRCVF